MFQARLQNIRQKLNEEKLDGVLISSVSNIEYFTGYSNFSKDEREAYILVGNSFQYIITDGRYSEAIKRVVPHFTLFERGHKNEQSSSTNKIENLFEKHQKEIKKLGIEEDNLTVSEHKILKKHFKNLKHFEIGNLRSIKTNDEIKKIKKAAKLGDATFQHILQIIKSGVSEKAVEYEIESFIRKNGAEISFKPIVAFGKNSSIPHHQTGNTKLEGVGRFVLLDFGVKLKNYCSDMTRTVFFGKLSDKQKKIYKTVLDVQQGAIDFVNSAIFDGQSIKAADVDKVARIYLRSQGYPDIPHSLGHGIGLEVHEHPSLSPKSRDYLKEGMVFSIEPGIYVPNFGGARIEDLFVLEKEGLKQITKAPKNLIII